MNLHLITTIGLAVVLALTVVFTAITGRRLREQEGIIKEQEDTIEGYAQGLSWMTELEQIARERSVDLAGQLRLFNTIFGRDPLIYHSSAKRNAAEYDPKTIAVDLDGVILKYDDVWLGPLHFDEPIPGVTDGLQKLRDQGFHIVVYTTRINPLAAGNQGFTAVEQMTMVKGVLDAWHIPYDKISFFKPLAAYYIDDRAIRFTDWKKAVKDIEKLESSKATPMSMRLK